MRDRNLNRQEGEWIELLDTGLRSWKIPHFMTAGFGVFLRFFFFLMWTIFKAFIVFVMIVLQFLCSGFHLWCRDQTCTFCIGRQSLNHWTTREVPWQLFYFQSSTKESPAEIKWGKWWDHGSEDSGIKEIWNAPCEQSQAAKWVQ